MCIRNKMLRCASETKCQDVHQKQNVKMCIRNKMLRCASETSMLTKRDRKQINIFERKMCRRILGPVYDNEKENWKILTNKEMYAIVKKKPP